MSSKTIYQINCQSW